LFFHIAFSSTSSWFLNSYLSRAVHIPFIGYKVLQAKRPPLMQFVGADSQFSAKPELTAVCESGGGIVIHRGRVYFLHKFIGFPAVGTNDGR
jgi:hypothetical protein